MKQKTMTKFITMTLTLAMTLSVPLTSYAAVRDNVGGGTLEGKTEIEASVDAAGNETNVGVHDADGPQNADGSLVNSAANPNDIVTTDEDIGTGTTDKMLESYQAFSNGILYTGTMKDYAGETKTTTGISLNSVKDTLLVNVPAKGRYDLNSKLAVNVASLLANPSVGAVMTAGTATASQIAAGQTAWVNGVKVTGTMTNKSGTTTTASTVAQSGTNAVITIPTDGYYDGTSKISIPVSVLKEKVSSLNSSFTSTVSHGGNSSSGYSLTGLSGFTKCTVVINGNSFTATTDNGKSCSGSSTKTFDITGATYISFSFSWGGESHDTRDAKITVSG